MNYLIVGIGGFLGAVARYGIYQCEKRFFLTQFPLATFLVNSLGCVLAGFLLGSLVKVAPSNHTNLHLFLSMGFIGSFTTFSTLGVESYKLISTGDWGLLLISLLANLGVGILCIYLGILASSRLLPLS